MKEVVAVLANMNMIKYEMDTNISKITGKVLFHCETVKDVQELIPMPATKASAMISTIMKFKAEGVPVLELVPPMFW